MKIKLVRTGGFIPITRVAEAEVDLSENEIALLLEIIKSSPFTPKIKDGNYWELTVGNVVTPVDLEKVPDKYRSLFVRLKGDLRIVK
jgi:hypothetical protein